MKKIIIRGPLLTLKRPSSEIVRYRPFYLGATSLGPNPFAYYIESTELFSCYVYSTFIYDNYYVHDGVIEVARRLGLDRCIGMGDQCVCFKDGNFIGESR